MRKVIKSPQKIGLFTITVIPNFCGVWGLYQYVSPRAKVNYNGKFCITLRFDAFRSPSLGEINLALKKFFGYPITLDCIKRNSFVTYSSENNSYFAAILKVKVLNDLKK